jgi:hypothetical protein
MSQRITIQLSVERVLPGSPDEVEIDLEVSGDITDSYAGTYLQPPESSEVENIIAIDGDGKDIELTDLETERATERLMDAACEVALGYEQNESCEPREDWDHD